MMRLCTCLVALIGVLPALGQNYMAGPTFHYGGWPILRTAYVSPAGFAIPGDFITSYRSPDYAWGFPYRTPYFGSMGYAYGYRGYYGYESPAYGFASYALAYPYPHVASYGVGYTANGYFPYASAYEGTTMLPVAQSAVVPWNYLASESSYGYTNGDSQDGTADSTARITLYVPENAEVTVLGKKLKQRGAMRTFTIPQLNGLYFYDIGVKWSADGKDVERKVNLAVSPGDRPSVTILR